MNKLWMRASVALGAVMTTTALSVAPADAATKKPKPSGDGGNGVPHPKPKMPKGLSDKLTLLLDILMGLALFACVAGIIICAIKLALAFRHGEAGEVAGKLGGVMGACVLVGAAASIVIFLYG